MNNLIKIVLITVILSSPHLAVAVAVDRSDFERSEFASAWSTKNKGIIVINIDRQDYSCMLNTRSLLLSESADTMRIGSGNVCIALTGNWIDFYTSEKLSEAKDIGIDHVVSVKDAWISGAKNWTKEQRNMFYNDPVNLVTTIQKLNSSKSDSTPSEWDYSFSSDKLKCKYLKNYIKTKITYGLSFDEDNIDYMDDFADEEACKLNEIFEYGFFGKSVYNFIKVR